MTARITRPEPGHWNKCLGYANRPYEHGATDGKPWIKHPGHRIDDVRRCEHGKVQICCWRDRSNTRITFVPNALDYEWRDISKFWERKLYRQAVAALGAEEAR